MPLPISTSSRRRQRRGSRLALALLLALPALALAGGGGPDKMGYRWIDIDSAGGPAYQWTEIRAIGTMIGTGDDASWAVALPKRFWYYGGSYDSLHICTNGFASFTSSSIQGLPPSAGFPDTAQPNACVAPYWNDLDVRSGDGSGLYTYHDTVNRRFIVEWDTVRRFYGSLDSFRFSFQAVLNYSDSSIVYYYRHANTFWQETYNGYTASKVGIENGDGSSGLDVDWNRLRDGYAVRFFHQPDSHDVKAVAVAQPGGFAAPHGQISCQALVANLGLAAESFPVSCVITRNDTVVFSDSATAAGLAPGDSLTVSFAPWAVGDPGQRYRIVMCCGLAADQNRSNDTVAMQCVAFPYQDKVNAAWRSGPITIDGALGAGEWPDSGWVDISDILSINSMSPPAGSAYLCAVNDSSRLYLAADIPRDTALENGDALFLYLDDNGNGAWAGDSTEGQYLMMRGHGSDTLIYTAYPSYAIWPHPGVSFATGISSGHVQYELSVPLGSAQPCDVNNAPGGTCRLHCMWQNGINNGVYAWWPQVMELMQDQQPAYFGTLALAAIGGVAGRQTAAGGAVPALRLWNEPNPFQRRTAICYQLPQAGQVTLAVYNVVGQCVSTMVNAVEPPGRHVVRWDAGRQAAGIYFCRLSFAGRTRTGKMQLVK